VFNPSPHARTDVVRIPLEDYPALRLPLGGPALGPLSLAVLEGSGFTIDGAPARLVPSEDPSRPIWVPGSTPLDLEFVARDVPALGTRRFRLAPAAAVPEVVDDGHEIAAGDVMVTADDAGTLSVRFGESRWTGLCGIEDRGDEQDEQQSVCPADDAHHCGQAREILQGHRHAEEEHVRSAFQPADHPQTLQGHHGRAIIAQSAARSGL